MKIFSKHIIIALALAALLLANATAQVQVFAQIDSQKDIYVGESFNYHIIIDGQNKPGKVDLAPLTEYNPQSAGNRDVSKTSISIINGKTTRNITKRYVMSYSLICNQAGPIELGPVKVTLGRETYETNPVSVNILEPGTTDKLDLEMTVSEQQCYIGQPVLLTVKFYFSADISNPQFNIPAFDSDAFYFENPDALGQQAKEFDLGYGKTAMVSQYQVVHKGQQSNLIILRKILIPKRSGAIKLESAIVSTDVVVGRSRSRSGFFRPQNQYKRFMVSSEPSVLTVLALPEIDKPDGFYGLVGKYNISASAKPTTDIYMGDPITLTIRISGSRYLKPIRWPQLEQVPEFAANFKIPSEKASPVIDNNSKVFTQTIRPDNNKANVIPSIPLAYFDPESGSYNIVKTKPIKLNLKPSRRLTSADIEGKDFVTVNKEVEAIRKGLSANYQGPDVLENMTFTPAAALMSPAYAPIWMVPLGVLILSIAVKLSTSTSPERTAAKIRRQAADKAISQLKKITKCESPQAKEQIVLSMKNYIGDRFDKVAGSLTGDDCQRIISGVTQDSEIAGEYCRIMEHCQSARFASIDVDIDSEKVAEIINLIANIEKKSKK